MPNLDESIKRIALFRVWDTHPIDHSIVRVLEEHFSEYRLDIFTIMNFLRARKDIQFLNLFSVIRHYGLRLLRGEVRFRQVFLRTPYLFRQVHAYAQSALRNQRGAYAFSFQLQSLFDTSSAEIPHFVYTDHTHLENLNYPGFSRKRLLSAAWVDCESEIYAHASRVFTRSTNISRSLIQQYHCAPEKVFCVYGGSNIETARPARQKDFHQHILFVGIDWERKGGPDLLAAFALVLRQHPKAHLTIVGAQPNIHHPQIQAAGRVLPDEMPQYYQNADIFCLPTKLEPFGAVFIEALSYRLPVIATEIGAIPDFVIPGENGYLLAPGDIQGIANAISDLLDQPQKCARFGEAGYALVQKRYNWANVGGLMRQKILEALTGE